MPNNQHAHRRPRSAANAARVYRIKPRSHGSSGKRPADLAALFEPGPYVRNQINVRQINKLRDWVDTDGLPTVAAALELSQLTVLRVCAGFAHRLLPATAAKLRAFFGE